MTAPTEPFEAARERFLHGVALLEQGRPAEAEQALLASLALLPGRPSTLSNLGLAQLQQGRPEPALQALDAALAAQPGLVEAWCHRAAALSALDREQEALASLERALALDTGHAAAQRQRALVLNRLGRHGEALAALDALPAADAGHGADWLLRGQTLQALRRDAEACAAYARAVALAPTLATAWSLLGQSLQQDPARRGEARHAFEQAIAHGADAAVHGYFLAALGGGAAPPAAPEGYVRGLFDAYAGDFETHLLQVLRYRAHEDVAAAALRLCPAPVAAALDLGCGTGLCGPLLRPHVQRLHGVDLSPTMLAQARARGAYDLLVQADAATYLAQTVERYGLVAAADVFIYLGDLAPVFAGVRRVLAPGGVFAFSVEALAESEGEGYALQPSLRYAHAEAYLRRLAAAHGLAVQAMAPTVLREDQRRPIHGRVAALRAPG